MLCMKKCEVLSEKDWKEGNDVSLSLSYCGMPWHFALVAFCSWTDFYRCTPPRFCDWLRFISRSCSSSVGIWIIGVRHSAKCMPFRSKANRQAGNTNGSFSLNTLAKNALYRAFALLLLLMIAIRLKSEFIISGHTFNLIHIAEECACKEEVKKSSNLLGYF